MTNRGIAGAIFATFVKLTGAQTIAGVKTFTSAPLVPDESFSPAKLTSLSVLGACPLRSSLYYTIPGTGTGTSQPPEATARGGVMIAGKTVTLTRLGVEITTPGSAGALIRLGLYLYDPATDTLSLAADGGTIDGTQAAGHYTVTVSVKVNVGDVLVPIAVVQGGATTRPTLRTRTSNRMADQLTGQGNPLTLLANAFQGFNVSSGMTAALPTTVTAAIATYPLGAPPPAVTIRV